MPTADRICRRKRQVESIGLAMRLELRIAAAQSQTIRGSGHPPSS
jgi:hypothetical protein